MSTFDSFSDTCSFQSHVLGVTRNRKTRFWEVEAVLVRLRAVEPGEGH